MGDRLNRVAQLKQATYLRGVEQILLDLALAPELADAIRGRIRRFYSAYLERVLDFAEGLIALVLTGAMHHTCGSVAVLLPDLIHAGLDALHSPQPEAATSVECVVVLVEAAYHTYGWC